jgi:two-component system, LytTR family, response regulator
MNRPRVVIVDDEPPARDKLRALVAADGRVDLVGEAGNGVSAVTVIERERPDLVLLDIQMPELDGFEVLEALELPRLPRVIFVTAYEAHAVRAFEIRAMDYLLKPVDPDRFRLAMDRALGSMADDDPDAIADRVHDMVRERHAATEPIQRFVVRQRGRMLLVPVEDVGWIGAAGNYVELHAGTESYLVRGSLQDLEARLDPARFVRVHRSTIANAARIREIQPWSHGDLLLVLDDGTRLRMSRRYRAALPGTFGL